MNKKTLAVLSVFFFLGVAQNNCMAQGFFSKLKDKVTAGSGSKEIPSDGPAQPLSQAKNMVSEVRSFTGISEDAFKAKMKAKGLKLNEENGCYSAKSSPYQYTYGMGQRDGKDLVNIVTRTQIYKNPTTSKLKTDYTAVSKACTDLKAALESASVSGKKTIKANKKKPEVYKEALDKAFSGQEPFSSKEPFGAGENYEEKDYNYTIALVYTPAFPQIPATGSISITVEDLTIETAH